MLKFDRTVPRWLVHRRAVSEVFLCDSVATGPDEFAVAAQLPRAHLLWSDRMGSYHDCLMAVEAGRQATIMLGHAHYGLARDLMMVARSSTVQVHDREAFRDDGATPLEGVFLMRLVDKVIHDGTPVSMTFEGDLFVADSNAMTMSGTLVFMPRQDYELLRAHSRARKQLARQAAGQAPVPVAPVLVGRRLRRNVVIGAVPGPRGAPEATGHAIIVDQANPCFFDHPLDHIPGQLLLEASRQNAIMTAVADCALPGPACMVTACRASFGDFAELDEIAECRAVVAAGSGAPGTARVQVSVRQFGEQVGDVEIEIAAQSDPAGDQHP